MIETHRFADGFPAGMKAFRGAFFRPNIVFLQLPQADVNLFGLSGEIDFEWARRLIKETRSCCLFVRGSGAESAVP